MRNDLHRRSVSVQIGAALVEFAILIPLLLLLLAGIVEIGYLYYHLNILNKSVQDGALWFSNPGVSRQNGENTQPIDVSNANSANIQKAQNLVIYGNTAGTGTSLLPNPTNNYLTPTYPKVTSPAANHIQITANYNHAFILGNALNAFCKLVGGGGANCFLNNNNSYLLVASAVFRVEGG